MSQHEDLSDSQTCGTQRASGIPKPYPQELPSRDSGLGEDHGRRLGKQGLLMDEILHHLETMVETITFAGIYR